jgi:hypothetical protein
MSESRFDAVVFARDCADLAKAVEFHAKVTQGMRSSQEHDQAKAEAGGVTLEEYRQVRSVFERCHAEELRAETSEFDYWAEKDLRRGDAWVEAAALKIVNHLAAVSPEAVGIIAERFAKGPGECPAE